MTDSLDPYALLVSYESFVATGSSPITLIATPAMANVPDDGELEDERWGNLYLKRKAGGTGYVFVTGPHSKSKVRPYQARIKNKRTGKTQSLGSFKTAHAAAVEVAKVLANGDDEDMESPQKRQKRGALPTSRPCLCLWPERPSCAWQHAHVLWQFVSYGRESPKPACTAPLLA